MCIVSIVTEWFYKESSDVRYPFLVSLSLMFVVCVPVALRSLNSCRWSLVFLVSRFGGRKTS